MKSIHAAMLAVAALIAALAWAVRPPQPSPPTSGPVRQAGNPQCPPGSQLDGKLCVCPANSRWDGAACRRGP